MKVTDNQPGQTSGQEPEILQSERLPSRTEVQETLNIRARNPEMDNAIPRTRTPFGVGRLRLGVTKIPGYHLHWIADYAGRLENALDNGYEFVKRAEVKVSNRDIPGQDDDRLSVIDRSTHETGKPLTLHLMKIKEEWYRENQEFYLERARAVQRQIKTGKIDGTLRKENYIPRGSTIDITNKLE